MIMCDGPTESSESNPRLVQVIAEYLRSIDAGLPVDREQLIAQHSDLADELMSFFRNRDTMELLVEPLKGSAYEPTIGLSESEPASELTRVRYFGDYELLDELGRGGMGVVYKARQVSLNRPVALKMILSGQLASADDVQRFKQEAEAAANLDHPHIAPIYETGEHEGQHYFSMKFIEGRSLRDSLPELRNNVRAGVQLLVQVARAVHHAHQRGVLHRDLKPANVLLDQAGVPYVTDFGLAKRVEGGSDVTQTGAIVGTPSYMAPEQAAAQKGLTTAVDVYSLGAMLYELLVGQPPFRGHTPLETLLQVREREPARPSAVNQRVDRDLETIALKCLEKDPPRRYDSAAALADDLERWFRREPIAARAVGRGERAWRWCQRNPVVAELTAAVVVALVGGGIVSSFFAVVATQRGGEAELSADLARHRLYASTLAEVEGLYQRDPAAAVELLLDEKHCPSDLREFCWGYYYRRCTTQQRYTLDFAKDGWVHSIAVAPDGSYAAASAGGVVLFDPATGTIQHKLPGGNAAGRLAISKHGNVLGAVSSAVTTRPTQTFGQFESFSTLFLWDTTTWGEPRTIERLNEDFVSLALTSDGQLAATSSRDGTVKLWDVETGALKQTLAGPGETAGSLAFSADDALLAVSYGTDDNAVQVWNVDESKVVATLATRYSGEEASDEFQSIGVPVPLVFSTDSTLLTGSAFQNARLWQALTGQAGHFLTVQRGFLNSIAFSPDETIIATAGGVKSQAWGTDVSSAKGALAQIHDGHLVGGHVKLWNAKTGQEIRTFYRPADEDFSEVAFVDDRRLLTATRIEGTVTCWDLNDKVPYTVIAPQSHGRELAFAPDGSRLAIVVGKLNEFGNVDDESLQLWDMTGDKPLIPASNWATKEMAYAPAGDQIAVISRKLSDDTPMHSAPSQIQFLSPADGAVLKQVPCPLPVNDATRITFAPDGRTLALICQWTVNLLDAATGADIGQIAVHNSDVLCIAFSPDGALLASGGADEAVKLWNVATRREQRTLAEPAANVHAADHVWSIAFSRNGTLASGGDSGTVKLWDVDRGRLLRTISAHRGPVRSVAFSPDGKTLATAGDDKLVQLWDPTTGDKLATLAAHTSAIRAVTFSPDGSVLVSSGDDRGVRLWHAG